MMTVVYLLIPTSNHNHLVTLICMLLLYIFWFLHQTTTTRWLYEDMCRCISFDSYIKPQLQRVLCHVSLVVYLLIPTSNHNVNVPFVNVPLVVYLLIPTSNHNKWYSFSLFRAVVYLLIPTSNHNCWKRTRDCCAVVYLLIPTSNHNYCAWHPFKP